MPIRLSFAIEAAIVIATLTLVAPAVRGDFLYTGYRNPGVTRIDETSGVVKGRFADVGFDNFSGMALGSDGVAYVAGINTNHIATNSWGVYRFNVDTGKYLNTFISGDLLSGIKFGPNGKFYGVNDWSGDLTQYGASTGARERTILAGANYPSGIGAFTLGEHGDLFAVIGGSKLARYDLISGQQLSPFTDLVHLGLPGYGFDQMTFAPNGQLLAAYSYHGRVAKPLGGIMRFDPLTGTLIDSVIDDLPAFGAAAGGSVGIAFGPDGKLYVGSQDAKAVLRYDPATWALIDQMPVTEFVGSPTFIQFLPVPEPAAAYLVALPILLRLPRRRQRQR